MAFSTETQALMTLGYGLVAINSKSIVFPAGLDADGFLYVRSLLIDIEEQDQKIRANIDDAMAVKVQDLGLDYGQYVSLARSAGSRLLEQLSAALDTPIAYDRFKNGARASSTGSGIAVRNYY